MLRIMCEKFTKWGLSRMRNRDWLNKMALIDLLNIINKRFDGCFVYRMEKENFDSVDGRCEKHGWDCQKCIAAWLNEES